MCVRTPLRLRELSAGSFPGRLTRGRSAHFARGERRIYVELRLISSSVNYINDEKVELTAFPLIFPSVFLSVLLIRGCVPWRREVPMVISCCTEVLLSGCSLVFGEDACD